MTAHPDKGGSEAKMATVNEAYEVLSKPGLALFIYRVLSSSVPYTFVIRASSTI